MNTKVTVGLILTFLITIATGCYYDKEELLYPDTSPDCNTINARFADISSIIEAKCATSGCHNSTAAAGGVILETYTQIRDKAGRINQKTLIEKTMPPDKPLSGSEIALIKCWINSGTPN